MSYRSRLKTWQKSVRGQYARRAERLQELGFPSYSAFLRSKLWADTKRKARKRGMTFCAVCGSREGVQLHHQKYEIRSVVSLENLIPLCDWCHGRVHQIAHNPNYRGTMRVAFRKHRRAVHNSPALSAFLAD